MRSLASLSIAILLALLAGRSAAAERYGERTLVAPGTNKNHFWSRHLDSAKAYELHLDVLPRGAEFEAGSAKVTPDGGATWMVTSNTETLAAFTGAVPEGRDEKRYSPVFDGRFQKGQGKGGGPTDLTWRVNGQYNVNGHVYEQQRVEEGEQPDRVTPEDEGIKHYTLTVPLSDEKGASNTTGELFAALEDPPGLFSYTLAGLKPVSTPALSPEKGLTDPTHGDEYMVRTTLDDVYEYTKSYHIRMPEWTPSDVGTDGAAPQPAEAASAEWQRIYNAILVHEQGHQTIYLAYVDKVDGLVNAHNRKLFVGEACYGAAGTASANNASLGLARALRTKARDELLEAVDAENQAHEQAQDNYEGLTNHGVTQSAHDPAATNVVHQGDIALKAAE